MRSAPGEIRSSRRAGEVLPSSRLAKRLRALRRRGKKVVFTNGCFDLLHRGHVELLQSARRMGDVLVVGLNSDASVRKLKGAGRPILPARDRARILSALRSVDFVTLFSEETPIRLIRLLHPDVLVKGGDYRPETIVGAREVTAGGGSVRVVPLVRGKSSTGLARKVQAL